jgi:hypothetical protein
MHRVIHKLPVILFIHRRRLAIQEGRSLLRATRGADPERARLFQALLLGTTVHIQEEAVSLLYYG